MLNVIFEGGFANPLISVCLFCIFIDTEKLGKYCFHVYSNVIVTRTDLCILLLLSRGALRFSAPLKSSKFLKFPY